MEKLEVEEEVEIEVEVEVDIEEELCCICSDSRCRKCCRERSRDLTEEEAVIFCLLTKGVVVGKLRSRVAWVILVCVCVCLI